MIFDLVSFLGGVLVGGVACAISAKVFGWFNKETAALKAKV